MREIKAFLIITLVFPFFLKAQEKNIYENVQQWDQQLKPKKVIAALSDPVIESFPPDSAKWLYERWARAYSKLGQYNRTVRLYENNIRPLIKSPEDYFSLRSTLLYGYALYSVGQLDAARQVFLDVQSNLGPSVHNDLKYKAWLNYSLIEWDTGNFKEYRQATEKALSFAQADNDSARQSLAYSNLAEYYELTENWEQAIKHIQLASNYVKRDGNLGKWTWLQIRKSSIQFNKSNDFPAAIQRLEQVRAVTDSAGIYQYWKKSSYELVSAYFKSGTPKQSESILLQMESDKRIKNNINDYYTVEARLVQLYAITDLIPDTKKGDRAQILRSKMENVTAINARLLGLHALAVRSKNKGDIKEAEQIAYKMFDFISNEVATGSEDNIATRLSNIYQTIKLEHAQRAHINALVKEKAVNKYINQIEDIDWVYRSSIPYVFRGIMLVLIFSALIAGSWYWCRKPSVSYSEMVGRIEA